MGSGCLGSSLDHIGSKVCLIPTPCSQSQFCEKSLVLSIEKLPFLVPSRNVIMIQQRIVQFPLNYLSSGNLGEAEEKREC